MKGLHGTSWRRGEAASLRCRADAASPAAPALRAPFSTGLSLDIVAPERLGYTGDPDALIRRQVVDTWRRLLETRECGVTRRAKEIAGDIALDAPTLQRREALAGASAWLGTLRGRLSLEQEDAVRILAERCGHSPPALEWAFHAKYWGVESAPEALRPSAADGSEPAL